MDDEPDEMRHDGEAPKAPDKGPVDGGRAEGRRLAGLPAEGARHEGAREVSLGCMSCEDFFDASLLRQLDACVDALESAAALVNIDGGRPTTPDDNRRLRTLNLQFDELRKLIDHLAISVVEMSHCCRQGEARQPDEAAQPAAATPAPAAHPSLALVSVNPHPRSRAELMPPGGPGNGKPTPTPTPAPRLRCI